MRAFLSLYVESLFLQGVQPNDLEQAHRDARNFLEGTLSRRPALSALLDKGYLEVRQHITCLGQLHAAVREADNCLSLVAVPVLVAIITLPNVRGCAGC